MRIRYYKGKTKIYDCYLIKNKDVPYLIDSIIYIRKFVKNLPTTRTRRSYIAETKAHNRLYKLGLFKKHTKNCDLEEDIKLWKEIVYRIIGV